MTEKEKDVALDDTDHPETVGEPTPEPWDISDEESENDDAERN